MKTRSHHFQAFFIFIAFVLLLVSPILGEDTEGPRLLEPTTTETTEPSEDIESLPKIVRDIKFVGNSLNKSRVLKKKVKTKEKKLLDQRQIRKDVKILFETGNFEDVEVKIEDMGKTDSKGRREVRVIYSVKERAIIKRIDFKGNKKIRSGDFLDKIQSEEGNPFDEFKASLDERAILEHYRNEGYANAEVEFYTSTDQKNKKMILTFFMTEGDRVLVKEIKITGLQHYKEKKIRKKMETRRKKVFKLEILQGDQARIEDFYKNNGFLDVTVSTPSYVIDEERNEARIEVAVDSGPKYKSGTFTFTGATIFTDKELKKAVTMKKGKLYRQKKLDESIINITNMYANKGYLRTLVNANPVRDPIEGSVNFDVLIEESSVVYVDGVYVDGNSYTKEYVIKREILLKKGDIFSASQMRRSVEKIYNLGFLEDVQVDVQQPRDPNLADLIFTVKEGKPGILSAGAGFSSVDRFVGSLQIQHTNLFGKAQRAEASFEFGGRVQSFDVRWTDPWFLGYRMTGGVDLFNTTRRRDFAGNRNAFRERRRGGSLRLGPRISDKIGLLFSYTVQTTKIFDVDTDIRDDLFPTFGIPEEEAELTGSVEQVKSAFTTEVARDTRDNRFDASRGSRNSVSVELAGGPYGGDINFYKPHVSSAWFFPTFWKFVLSVNAQASWATHFAPSNDVPSSERFFLGGANTVRGYDQNSIVPRIKGRSEDGALDVRQIPGRIFSLVNVEYKFPIVQERNRTIFQGAFFLDVGGTWLRTKDIRLKTGARDDWMKAGVGFGFRFKTPVFPIRLDFGIPLNPRNFDGFRDSDSRSLQPYFTIGNIF